jgi:hypothetical protein
VYPLTVELKHPWIISSGRSSSSGLFDARFKQARPSNAGAAIQSQLIANQKHFASIARLST